MPLQNIIKIFQTIKKLWRAQKFGLEICSGEVTRKRMEQELIFLHAIQFLDLYSYMYNILSKFLKQYGTYGLHKISTSGVIT